MVTHCRRRKSDENEGHALLTNHVDKNGASTSRQQYALDLELDAHHARREAYERAADDTTRWGTTLPRTVPKPTLWIAVNQQFWMELSPGSKLPLTSLLISKTKPALCVGWLGGCNEYPH